MFYQPSKWERLFVCSGGFLFFALTHWAALFFGPYVSEDFSSKNGSVLPVVCLASLIYFSILARGWELWMRKQFAGEVLEDMLQSVMSNVCLRWLGILLASLAFFFTADRDVLHFLVLLFVFMVFLYSCANLDIRRDLSLHSRWG